MRREPTVTPRAVISALVLALQTGQMPALVVTWHLGAGGATVAEVTYNFLGPLSTTSSKLYGSPPRPTRGGEAPASLSDGPHCSRCPAWADCPPVDGLERLAAAALGTGATVWPVDPKGLERPASELLGPELPRRLQVPR
jgi:hypothetical protein